MKKLKKPLDPTELSGGPKLTREQYLEWRTFIYDIDLAKSQSKIKEQEVNLHHKDAEIAMLRKALAMKEYVSVEATVSHSKTQYENYRKYLGQQCGVNLDGAIIDPVTLSVTNVDQKASL